MTDLEQWLSTQNYVKQIHRLGYHLLYKDTWCYAQITITPYNEEMAIKPMRNVDDIGLGKGQPVYKSFKRLSFKNSTEAS